MGYACPVCSDPQADRSHLANHLAFTAMLGDEAHEAWLEGHAPGWTEMGERELGDAVVDDVAETEFPQVFEDTAGGLGDDAEPPEDRSGALFEDARSDEGRGHDHDHDHDPAAAPSGSRVGDAPMDGATEAVLEEAREMTRRMLEDDGEGRHDREEDEGSEGPAAGADGETDPDEDRLEDNNG